jgi:hypothetical protein
MFKIVTYINYQAVENSMFFEYGVPKKISFALLAPINEPLTRFAGDLTFSKSLHSRLFSEMQRLRGRIYLADGALAASDIDPWGRHVQASDSKSWHLLVLGSKGRVIGCTRMRRHSTRVSWGQLGIQQAPIALSDEWGLKFRASIDAELAAARSAGFSYVEVGGWALSKEIRGTFIALKTVLATYAWSQLLGGALGIATATERNQSAAILRRLGGRSLTWDGVELPPYYDNRYRCQMEVLRFDSRDTNPRYAAMLEELREEMARAPVICAEKFVEERHYSLMSESYFEPQAASG